MCKQCKKRWHAIGPYKHATHSYWPAVQRPKVVLTSGCRQVAGANRTKKLVGVYIFTSLPKRNSPRKFKKRNRRRIQCSRCGASYSYSGSRSHSCGGDALSGSDEADLEHGDNVNEISDTELHLKLCFMLVLNLTHFQVCSAERCVLSHFLMCNKAHL